MALAEGVHADHHDHHHEHGEFIAHHFDNAEQQFDSGKLGIWVFLITEVLFFSGLFVAYILWRSHHPEIFEQAHVFLDKWLGGINTVVLLFSSLTMAWAVRCAQTSDNRGAAILILITMVCAAIFLGVKAIEYSHKWDQGILVRSLFDYKLDHAEPTRPLAKYLHVSDYLIVLSAIPAVLLVGFIAASGFFALTGKTVMAKFMASLAITVGGYFAGVLGGHFYMQAQESGKSHAGLNGERLLLQADDKPVTAAGAQTAAADGHDQTAGTQADGHAHGDHAAGDHAAGGHAAGGHGHQIRPEDLDRDVGIFFSIYYCMTGLHAIHIIGGIAALSWILYRSLLGHWRADYFGPVDFVGLYWHLVDLIWIYLFPMLYLID